MLCKSALMNCKNPSEAKTRSTRRNSKNKELPKSKNYNRGIAWTTSCRTSSTSKRREMSELLVCRIVLRIRRKPCRRELIVSRSNKKLPRQLPMKIEIKAKSGQEPTSKFRNSGVSSSKRRWIMK